MRNVIGSLYLDVSFCLPFSVYGLQRQHFSAFECSCEMHKLPGFVASQSSLMTGKGTCPTLSAPTIITISYVSETKEKKRHVLWYRLLVITPKTWVNQNVYSLCAECPTELANCFQQSYGFNNSVTGYLYYNSLKLQHDIQTGISDKKIQITFWQ